MFLALPPRSQHSHPSITTCSKSKGRFPLSKLLSAAYCLLFKRGAILYRLDAIYRQTEEPVNTSVKMALKELVGKSKYYVDCFVIVLDASRCVSAWGLRGCQKWACGCCVGVSRVCPREGGCRWEVYWRRLLPSLCSFYLLYLEICLRCLFQAYLRSYLEGMEEGMARQGPEKTSNIHSWGRRKIRGQSRYWQLKGS